MNKNMLQKSVEIPHLLLINNVCLSICGLYIRRPNCFLMKRTPPTGITFYKSMHFFFTKCSVFLPDTGKKSAVLSKRKWAILLKHLSAARGCRLRDALPFGWPYRDHLTHTHDSITLLNLRNGPFLLIDITFAAYALAYPIHLQMNTSDYFY